MAAVPHTRPIAAVPSGRLAPALRLVKAAPGSQVGTPVRIFAVVIVLAVLAAAVGAFVLGGAAAPAATPKVIVPYKDRNGGAAPAKAAPAAPGKAAARKPAAAKPLRAPKPAVRLVSGLPPALAAALRANRVVVVSLYSPRSAVAEMARAEAGEGAALAGAGFVEVNVYRAKQVEELAATYQVLNDPSVLVFRRPGVVAVRLDGFADRELVAQAAANAVAKR